MEKEKVFFGGFRAALKVGQENQETVFDLTKLEDMACMVGVSVRAGGVVLESKEDADYVIFFLKMLPYDLTSRFLSIPDVVGDLVKLGKGPAVLKELHDMTRGERGLSDPGGHDALLSVLTTPGVVAALENTFMAAPRYIGMDYGIAGLVGELPSVEAAQVLALPDARASLLGRAEAVRSFAKGALSGKSSGVQNAYSSLESVSFFFDGGCGDAVVADLEKASWQVVGNVLSIKGVPAVLMDHGYCDELVSFLRRVEVASVKTSILADGVAARLVREGHAKAVFDMIQSLQGGSVVLTTGDNDENGAPIKKELGSQAYVLASSGVVKGLVDAEYADGVMAWLEGLKEKTGCLYAGEVFDPEHVIETFFVLTDVFVAEGVFDSLVKAGHGRALHAMILSLPAEDQNIVLDVIGEDAFAAAKRPTLRDKKGFFQRFLGVKPEIK